MNRKDKRLITLVRIKHKLIKLSDKLSKQLVQVDKCIRTLDNIIEQERN